jgi:hypothetical protein
MRFALSPKGRLLVTGRKTADNSWFSCSTGTRLGRIDSELLDCEDLTCDRDGGMLILKGRKLRRLAPEGAEVPAWPGDASQSEPFMGPRALPDRPVAMNTEAGMRICNGPDGSIYLMDFEEIARFDASGRKIYGVKLPSDAAGPQYRVLGADLLGNAYVLRRKKLVRISPTGERSVILESKRDALPREEMSLTVCPDGSFWLFGRDGLAWKLDPGGGLLFASEKDPKFKKPSAQEAWQRAMDALEAQGGPEKPEWQRLADERKAAELRKSQRHVRIFLLGAGAVVFLVVVGLLVVIFWY